MLKSGAPLAAAWRTPPAGTALAARSIAAGATTAPPVATVTVTSHDVPAAGKAPTVSVPVKPAVFGSATFCVAVLGVKQVEFVAEVGVTLIGAVAVPPLPEHAATAESVGIIRKRSRALFWSRRTCLAIITILLPFLVRTAPFIA